MHLNLSPEVTNPVLKDEAVYSVFCMVYILSFNILANNIPSIPHTTMDIQASKAPALQRVTPGAHMRL